MGMVYLVLYKDYCLYPVFCFEQERTTMKLKQWAFEFSPLQMPFYFHSSMLFAVPLFLFSLSMTSCIVLKLLSSICD